MQQDNYAYFLKQEQKDTCHRQATKRPQTLTS